MKDNSSTAHLHKYVSGEGRRVNNEQREHGEINETLHFIGLERSCEQHKRSSGMECTSGDIIVASIRPVMFAWPVKWRRRVISRSARFASWILSKTRETSLIATVSPVISSPAELWNGQRSHNAQGNERTLQHHTRPNPFLE
jgi:hypothetical protein